MSDFYKFVILDSIVKEVYECDDGNWELVDIDLYEIIVLDGDSVLKIER